MSERDTSEALPPAQVVAIFSRGIRDAPEVRAALGAQQIRYKPTDAAASEIDCVVGWGCKPNTASAQAYAERHGLPYLRIEDGFLRSVGLGVHGAPALSLVFDDCGIYYDAQRPSRLERMLARAGQGDPLADAALRTRARQCIDRIVAAQLSKYNDSPPELPELPPAGPGGRVLVVDQTAGDMSVERGRLHADGFDGMLRAALDDNPTANVIVKTHPDVLAGKKRGYLTHAGGERVHLWAAPANPIALLQQVDRVYVGTSQLGFEALMVGKPVTCFGVPFYAGWGLTDDRGHVERRGVTRTLDQVFAAAYLMYARYLDPSTGERCEIERVIEHLALQRAMFARNQGRLYCLGFTPWKRNFTRDYLRCPGNQVRFARTARDAERQGFDAGARLVAWGQRAADDVAQLEQRHGVHAERMEDGFLRSVGLGSDFTAPASLVLDGAGIYYDPQQPSDLEQILQGADFSEQELARARALREAIVTMRISKYNVGAGQAIAQGRPVGARVILVPGQVEQDASIQLGCVDVRTNRDLLQAARERAPDAYLVYKPHPDVLSGNRDGTPRSDGDALADEVVFDATLADCLDVADEVHTMTSLVGFEGLLRGKRVATYGRPFYAGWGLTDDRHPIARRTRRLSLDALCAGALLRYPRYLDPMHGFFASPEDVLLLLQRQLAVHAGPVAVRQPWITRKWRKLVHTYKALVPRAR